jgi:membrane fusion protein (multidrug efflux system)
MIGLVCLAAAAAGCSDTAAVEKVARPVRVAAAEPATTARGARYSAEIAPSDQLVLAFKNSGYVEHLLQTRDSTGRLRDVERGDRIVGGTVLARVQGSDYEAQAARATASVRQAEAALVKARADFARAEALFAVDALTQPDLDAARAAHDSAVAQSAGAEAQLATAHVALGDVSLKAPQAAVVLERRVERGALVTAGTPGFVLGTVNPVNAVFGVPDATVRHLRMGAPLTITTDAVPDRAFTGRIVTISPAADPETRLFLIEVSIANDDASLRPGMIATVELGAERGVQAPGLPSIPLTAVVKNEGGYGVFVLADNGADTVAAFRPVILGELIGNAIQIVDGLRAGERVIVSAPSMLKQGDAVAVIP